MTKSLDDSFIDWESTAFGYGYGSGEPHTLAALKAFFAAFEPDCRGYDYVKLEEAVTPTVAWLLINTLAKHNLDIIEYGTSPRFGWLTSHGEALKAYVDSKSVDQLVDLICSVTTDNDICYPDACNCGPNGYEKGRVCQNPFWPRRK